MPLVSTVTAMDKWPMQSGPNDPSQPDERPAVAIFRSPLLNASETFVRAHALSLTRYRPVLAGRSDKGNIPAELRAHTLLGTPSQLARRVQVERPVLVHAHFGPDGLAALPLARALAVPLITTLHGYDVSRSRARMLLSGRVSWMRYALRRRTLMEQGELFLAVSEALRARAIAQGFPAERTRTHYLGVDLRRFQSGGERERGLILHVGRLVEKKGTAVLLKALARLPNARLVIVGDGPERQALERQAGALGERVRFLGALAADEVSGWMRRAWLLASPSLTARDGDAEGLPTVIVEAAASGLPSVATHHSGIPEAVLDGETGFLVPEGDADALAEKMDILLGSDDLRDKMGSAAHRLAEERFDLRTQTARLEDIYDGVLESRTAAG